MLCYVNANMGIGYCIERSMSLGAKNIRSYIKSLERIGRGCTGMKDTPRNMVKIMQITSLLKMMMKIFLPIGFAQNSFLWYKLFDYICS